jgi:malate synthase
MATATKIRILAPSHERAEAVLTPEALAFLGELHRRFEPTRRSLLAARQDLQASYDAGGRPAFRPDGADVRAGEWRVAPAPPALAKRWVEITGPTERKMLINALNSGATGFMADLEDANTPTWANMIEGQANLAEAVAGTIEHRTEDGREYRLDDQVATLLVRPRGLHLSERHLLVGEEPIAASLFDFGLSFFHNAHAQIAQGAGPYYYLPKLQRREEARLWNDVFLFAQEALGIPPGTIKATVLVETLPAAFEMDELLFELREHSAGLNAGRWDYIFSAIKTLRLDPGALLPDRAAVTMTVPFMRAYTELLVSTCHRRGAHAIGGMAAFIPNRSDPEATESALRKVRADKEREAADGFDGSWVAHPDLVPVALEVFGAELAPRPNQLERLRPDVQVGAEDLLDLAVPGASVTEPGVRANISVAIRYLAAWLGGSGAVAIDNLMEDVATAEIARAQVWQWVRHGAELGGAPLDAARIRGFADEEMDAIRARVGEEAYAGGHFDAARALFEQIALADRPVDFLTEPAYSLLEADPAAPLSI